MVVLYPDLILSFISLHYIQFTRKQRQRNETNFTVRKSELDAFLHKFAVLTISHLIVAGSSCCALGFSLTFHLHS